MDKSNQKLSSSLQQLLEELESLIVLELERSGNSWISVARLAKLFHNQYGISLEEKIKIQGYSDGLRSLLKSSRRFSIYSSPIPQQFYVALLQRIVPDFQQPPITTTYYKSERLLKIDGLLKRMKAESTEESSCCQAPLKSEHCSSMPTEIKSVNDLEIALMKIIKNLSENNPKKFVLITVLSRKFYDYYQQPIKAIVKSMCPGIKLIELLKTIPDLDVQKVNHVWQVAVKPYSVE
ncbi:hypothetical protein H6F76_21090 [Leptolyngbya sp. FACHB-321]|uniref:hypothetical protein n=1 Tax=Leptolyngbya sp. FACHB-321 TaxID=2692807 RepID=UPI001687D460|nr:hypothetical protein [Leptolyngbya sp. FACHB-321]MBD2037461.1 hypothetical protein [Leptolyngbya sp. FACHB-321]